MNKIPLNIAGLDGGVIIKKGGGGGVTKVISKDVNFYDYDGTLLHSYTWDEAVALTALPPLPEQKGLICQEWNYTLDDIKAQTHHMADVGATYTTDDGRTRLYLKIDNDFIPELKIAYHTAKGAEIEFDWGDGSPVDSFTTSSATKGVIAHQYAEKGEYVISIYSSSPYFSLPTAIDNNDSNCFSGSDVSVSTWLRRVELAHFPNENETQSLEFSFYGFPLLETVTLCSGDREGVNGLLSTFNDCKSLKAIVFPRGIVKADGAIFYCNSLEFVSWPNTINVVGNTSGPRARRLVFPEKTKSGSSIGGSLAMVDTIAIPPTFDALASETSFMFLKKVKLSNAATSVPANMARGARLLECVEIPDTVTSIGGYAFYSCSSLREVILPKGLTTINMSAFNGCGVETLAIPNGVKDIPANTFKSCSRLRELYFTEHTEVPTLGNANALNSTRTDLKIIVPDALYDTWIAATNWSTHASKIIKKSDWDASQS